MKHWIDGTGLDSIMRIIAGKHYTLQDSSDFQEHATNFSGKRYTSNGEDIGCEGRAPVGATGGWITVWECKAQELGLDEVDGGCNC
ncbi:hypothetical protein CUMW_238480 [Citrus unshiu]|uniref:Uncharacterized protein n=1 Tax=Citrus unshiu TaxID=55188 RepID=A0A2H5QKD2_CITUN|nr:hypothetical protein CUMW_238480 [Citrus unshiu]